MLKRNVPALMMLLLPFAATAQSKRNPVSDTFRTYVTHNGKNLLEAAEAMPADKYTYKPTPAQWSFGQIVVHIAGDNHITCSAIAGVMPVPPPKISATAPKETQVAALKSSIAFCESAVAKVTDAMLGDSVTYYDSRALRIDPLVGLVMDWSDHYGQQAGYLRLNGILPPTAKEGGQ